MADFGAKLSYGVITRMSNYRDEIKFTCAVMTVVIEQ